MEFDNVTVIGGGAKGIPGEASLSKIDRQTGIPVAVVTVSDIEQAAFVHQHRAAHVKDMFRVVGPTE